MSASVKMMVAQLTGQTYPPDGVPDTPENHQLWQDIAADLADMKAKGISPDVPWEYADEEGML